MFPDVSALRVSLTSSDGNEAAQIVQGHSDEDEVSVQEFCAQLRTALSGTERADLRLAAIAQLLKEDLLSKPKPSDGMEGWIPQ